MQTVRASIAKIQRLLSWGRVLRLVWQSSPQWTVARTVLLFMQGLMPLLWFYIVKLIVDATAAGVQATNTDVTFNSVLGLLGMLGLVVVIMDLSDSASEFVDESQALLVTNHIFARLHGKAISADLEYYENPEYYDTLHHTQKEAPARTALVLKDCVDLCRGLISLLAVAGVLLSLHWMFIVLLVVTKVPEVLAHLKYAREVYRLGRQQASTERKANYFNWLLTDGWHAKENRLFALGEGFMQRFQDLRQQLFRERLAILLKNFIRKFLGKVSGNLAGVALLVYVTDRAFQGEITIGDYFLFYWVFRWGTANLQLVLRSLVGLYENNLFLSSLYEFLALPSRVKAPLEPRAIARSLQTGIEFEQVSFQYPTGTRQCLEEITLSIRPGELVALVGENGVGKTTLIKLLCRLYDPTAGRITWNGINLREFDPTELRQAISVVFQDYAHYDLTVRENIAFGKLAFADDTDRVVQAAKSSGAHAFIQNLPQQYETVLGKRFDEGEELSIGQWQKIAIARAFFRDAQVIVLDEPTSALDAKAEAEVFEQFRRLADDRAAVMISHRLSSVKKADRIYVFDQGRIVEQGRHDELIQQQGIYARMFEMQAQHYR
ncbi:ABC transporter ATP-binding protein [filamentous cyanobacterium LEGE 11480]|uniref:ABC transporter ATP-binding protein n=1 Tax=Romeriopsis navalis LEGE 11480 TaxID=2777977 RepID=A0A928VLK3_9CYAN|nr:ABC transporter ATP-binding protein [Romeriopsis navalis]MBE9028856.1 ABC transporter ATP-binding protein [Romeriopsis navalis LEGE 11480]